MARGLAVTLVALLFSACGTIAVTGFQNVVDCTDVKADFAADVFPIFASAECSASGCHAGASPAGDLGLDGTAATVFQNITTTTAVDTDDPKSSTLITKPLKGTVDHDGGDQFETLSDSGYVTIFCWVSDGAQDN